MFYMDMEDNEGKWDNYKVYYIGDRVNYYG